jgi:hypothetical protein
MDTSTPPQKKGLGPVAWIGIGCGSLVLIGIIVFAVIAMVVGPKVKKFAEDAQANPTKAMANMMVTASVGQIEMIAEDDANKRYTIRQKADGKLTTVYWSSKNNAPEIVEGDFTAIPADNTGTEESPPSAEPK